MLPHCPQLQNIASVHIPQRVHTQPAFGFSLALASASAAEIRAPDRRGTSSLSDLLCLGMGLGLTDKGLISDFGRSPSQALQVALLIGLTSVQVSQDHVVGAGGGEGELVRSTTTEMLWVSVFGRLLLGGGDGVVLEEPSSLDAGLGCRFEIGDCSELHFLPVFVFPSSFAGSSVGDRSADCKPVLGFH